MTVKEAMQYCLDELVTLYPEGEARAIAELVVEQLSGLKRTEQLVKQDKELDAAQLTRLDGYLQRLQEQEPVQYVLNQAWFYGLKFYVDENVLIPRPETEELIEWIITDCKFPIDQLKILDIGSGSGCIPISIKRKLRKAELWSVDISQAALNVAQKNAEQLGAAIQFLPIDFLDKRQRETLPVFDIIVSNPPYIPVKDKATMQPNVVNYEPSLALFVPDEDPLVFYKAIAAFGKTHLTDKGNIYVEIQENSGKEVVQLFEEQGYVVELKKDMQGKERMVKTSFEL